jgi:hypothetical protein
MQRTVQVCYVASFLNCLNSSGLLHDGCEICFSDSSESAMREIGIIFPDFSINKWFLKEAEYFNTGTVKLCAQEFVHIISVS